MSALTQKNSVGFFAWTGERFIAVEIDGASHIGSEEHVRKDRALQRAVEKLIPREVTMPKTEARSRGTRLACPLGSRHSLTV
jgi:hypothetical protein